MKEIKIVPISKDWSALKKWDLDYIQSLTGDQIATICNNEHMVNRLNTWCIKQYCNA